MRAVSKKRAAQQRLYSQLRRQFLEARPVCEFPRCGYQASEVHHMAGRVGPRYLDVELWLPLCHSCHQWVTENPAAAVRLGVSKPRIGAA